MDKGRVELRCAGALGALGAPQLSSGALSLQDSRRGPMQDLDFLLIRLVNCGRGRFRSVCLFGGEPSGSSRDKGALPGCAAFTWYYT